MSPYEISAKEETSPENSENKLSESNNPVDQEFTEQNQLVCT